MKNNQKLFAFKLADKKQEKTEVKPAQWKARDGVAVAGCTFYQFDYKCNYNSTQDGGVWC